MQIAPHAFWRLSLAEWRAMLAGYEQRIDAERKGRAWSASYTLIAAGCEPDKVTPDKLLGNAEPKQRRSRKVKSVLSSAEVFARMPRCDASGKLIAAGSGKVIDGEV